MQKLMAALKRAVLKFRIESLKSDMLLADERRSYALMTAESIDSWQIDAHCRLRSLRARYALLERPEILLKEAIRE